MSSWDELLDSALPASGEPLDGALILGESLSVDDVYTRIDEAYQMGGAGYRVDSYSALRQATVWACVRIVSEIMAHFPIGVKVKQGATWKEARDHDVLGVLAEPNSFMTQHELIAFVALWAEYIGNGYLYKIRDTKQRVRQLLPIEGRAAHARMTTDWRLEYQVTAVDGGIQGTFGADKIFHHRNFGTAGYVGLSTIGNHRRGIGLAMQLEEHATSAYKNGLQTARYITSEKPIVGPALDTLKGQVQEYSGSVRAGKTPIFTNGAMLKELGPMNLVDVQYMDSRRMQKQEIASVFGVPLFLLNDTEKSTTWGTGLEQLSKSFIRFSLGPRLNRLAQTLLRELIPIMDRRKTEFFFDTDKFEMGSFKERMDGYKSGIDSGVLNPNECREMEDRNPREGGNVYRIPSNTQTEEQAAAAAATPTPAEPTNPQETDAEEGNDK